MVDKSPKKDQLTAIRRDHARKIVRSILTEGLLPAAEQRAKGGSPLLSMDDKSFICGQFVFPPNQQFERLSFKGDSSYQSVTVNVNGYTYKQAVPTEVEDVPGYLLQKALYGSAPFPRELVYSALPVIAERRDESFVDWKEDVVQERMQNNVLVVVPVSRINPNAYVPPGDHEDIRVNQSVHPIGVMLIPEGLRQDLGDLVPSDNFVGNITRSVLNPFVKKDLHIPNYEAALRELVATFDEPVFIHAVRLPTIEDVASGRIG